MTVIVAGTSITGTVSLPALSGLGLSAAVNLLSRLGPGGSGFLAGAIATSASSGAIFGAALGRSTLSALTGAVSGGAGSAILATGPLGWAILGSSEGMTFDCWKPVLHDLSTEPSNGLLLKDVVCDPRIKDVTVTLQPDKFPEIVLENKWSEKFRIELFVVDGKKLVAHAIKC